MAIGLGNPNTDGRPKKAGTARVVWVASVPGNPHALSFTPYDIPSHRCPICFETQSGSNPFLAGMYRCHQPPNVLDARSAAAIRPTPHLVCMNCYRAAYRGTLRYGSKENAPVTLFSSCPTCRAGVALPVHPDSLTSGVFQIIQTLEQDPRASEVLTRLSRCEVRPESQPNQTVLTLAGHGASYLQYLRGILFCLGTIACSAAPVGSAQSIVSVGVVFLSALSHCCARPHPDFRFDSNGSQPAVPSGHRF